MSQENVERRPIALRAHSRRRLDERLYLRFPSVLALLCRAVWRLPARSRLRQTLIRHALKLGIEAHNRGDLEAAVTFYHPDVEYVTPPQLIALGFAPVYRGRGTRISVQEKWLAEWGDFQFRPDELVEVGETRMLVLGRMEGSGLSSGVALVNEWGSLFTVSAGQVTREQVFFDHAQALEAPG